MGLLMAYVVLILIAFVVFGTFLFLYLREGAYWFLKRHRLSYLIAIVLFVLVGYWVILPKIQDAPYDMAVNILSGYIPLVPVFALYFWERRLENKLEDKAKLTTDYAQLVKLTIKIIWFHMIRRKVIIIR